MDKFIELYNYYKIYILSFILFLLIIISFTVLYFKIDNSKTVISNSQDISLKEENKVEEDKKEEEKYYSVDIKGQVLNPGVFKVKIGSIVDDVIKLAGGLKKEADTSLISLSKKVKDEMVIIIFSEEEVKSFKKDEVKIVTVIEKCECKDSVNNDACIDKDNVNIPIVEDEDTIENKKISINTGTKEELMNLTGIGEAKADDIISYREKNGLFQKIEDIMNVSGIGESLFAKIKENIII
ncbi:MAG: helix-hairpin-helix domain-containing protein [Bacilli bacterium]|nr:helix-hairpin-helix domain-containing protein [Bacilli bacterium]